MHIDSMSFSLSCISECINNCICSTIQVQCIVFMIFYMKIAIKESYLYIMHSGGKKLIKEVIHKSLSEDSSIRTY